MYHFLFGLSTFKAFSPYFRKHILLSLDSHEFLFMNTFLISTIVFCIFIYKLFFDKTIHITLEKYRNLTFAQFGCFVVLAVIAVSSSLLITEFDKKLNTPLINSILFKFAPVAGLFLISTFLFRENYTRSQLFGLILAFVGVLLLTNKNLLSF